MYDLSQYLLLGLACAGQVASRPSCAEPKVTLTNGSYAGLHSREYNQDFFLGMPYAKPAKRFTVAESLDETWEGVRDAKEYSVHCVGYGGDSEGFELSEDCLYINVVRPAGLDNTANLPVAVWIHGGGLFAGGAPDPRYNLSFIVEESVQLGTPMIGVSMNYRLSAFGFLNSKEVIDAGIANLGFRDQRLALHWVQENIGPFGGSPDKVTIWGESAGAESITAHVLAYNGRDDGLFRGAIGQSNFGGMIPRLPGGFNATAMTQSIYDTFVASTSCAHLVGSPESIDCLREAPFEELDAPLAGGLARTWTPALDGDFIQDYLANQLEDGRFVQVPLLVGGNTDEGVSFRQSESGGVDTDEEFAALLSRFVVSDSVDQTTEELVAELMELYPNDQSVGIPSLETWPHVIEPGDTYAQQFGLQYRRESAVMGDIVIHYPRKRANLAWSAEGVPNYAYRFNIMPHGTTGPQFGSNHFKEVAFVFLNFRGDGYDPNPLGGDDEEYKAQAKDVAKTMGAAWINFVTSLDPNGQSGLPNDTVWQEYSSTGGDSGKQLVFDLGENYLEDDDWREEGMAWFIEYALSVFGN